jgi:hypothetical protein
VRFTPIKSRCPICEAQILWKELSLSTDFKCPACKQKLAVSKHYCGWLYGVSVLVTALIAFGLGAREEVFFLALLTGIFPTMMIIVLLARFVAPPTLRASDDLSLDLYIRR